MIKEPNNCNECPRHNTCNFYYSNCGMGQMKANGLIASVKEFFNNLFK